MSRAPGPLADLQRQRKAPLSQPLDRSSRKSLQDKNGQSEHELGCSGFVARYVEMYTFDVAIGIIIFLNAINIGVEQSLQVAGHDTLVCQILESIFLVVYIIEFGARLIAYGVACFRDHWVKFDAFLVVIGITCSWVIEPFVDASPDELGVLMVLRVLRLLRLLKTARLFSQIQEFLRLVHAILNSTTIVMCALLLVFIIVYVFSSLGMELITKHKLTIGSHPDKQFQDQVGKYFSNLPRTMLTLLQFVTLDDMSAVYKPLIDKDPWLSLYFILLMVVLSIVLMNMVAAVIFSCILEQEQTERDGFQRGQEEEWAQLIRDLKGMFLKADSDGSGQLSKEEVLAMDESEMNNLKAALGVTTPLQVFNSLDVDGNGELNINEFFDGIWDCALARRSPDLKRLEKQVESMYWRLKETFVIQHDIRVTVDKLNHRLEQVLHEENLLNLGYNTLPSAAVAARATTTTNGGFTSQKRASLPPGAFAASVATTTTHTNGVFAGLDFVGRQADATGFASEKGCALRKEGTSAREPHQSTEHHSKPNKPKAPLKPDEGDQEQHSATPKFSSTEHHRKHKKLKSTLKPNEVDQEKHSAMPKSSSLSPARARRENHSIINELRWASKMGTSAMSSFDKLGEKMSTQALPDPVVVLPEPMDPITRGTLSELP